MKYYEIGAIILGLVAGTVQADPVQWQVADGGNGHWYELVYDGNDSCWADAKIKAEAQGGHLATITSQGEQDFLEANVFDSSVWMWVGGYQDLSDPDYSEPAGGWKWVTGEPMDYTHWYSGSWGEMPWDQDPPNHHVMQVGMTWWNLMWKTSQECATPEPSSYIVEWNHDPSIIQWRIEDGGNGHWYEAVRPEGSFCWEDARADAENQSGYLSTITSQGEQDFLEANVIDSTLGWFVGGYQDTEDPDYSEPEGAWKWVTGEPWDYTHWYSGSWGEMPSDPKGNENILALGMTWWGLMWKNAPACTDPGYNGYIIEYTTLPGSALGACCLDGMCITTAAADCSGNSGSWGGPDSSCADFDCPVSCPGDLNGDGVVGVDDLLMIIAAWGACP